MCEPGPGPGPGPGAPEFRFGAGPGLGPGLAVRVPQVRAAPSADLRFPGWARPLGEGPARAAAARVQRRARGRGEAAWRSAGVREISAGGM